MSTCFFIVVAMMMKIRIIVDGHVYSRNYVTNLYVEGDLDEGLDLILSINKRLEDSLVVLVGCHEELY